MRNPSLARSGPGFGFCMGGASWALRVNEAIAAVIEISKTILFIYPPKVGELSGMLAWLVVSCPSFAKLIQMMIDVTPHELTPFLGRKFAEEGVAIAPNVPTVGVVEPPDQNEELGSFFIEVAAVGDDESPVRGHTVLPRLPADERLQDQPPEQHPHKHLG